MAAAPIRPSGLRLFARWSPQPGDEHFLELGLFQNDTPSINPLRIALRLIARRDLWQAIDLNRLRKNPPPLAALWRSRILAGRMIERELGAVDEPHDLLPLPI